MNNEIKKIIHIDMDAFYASVEQRDNPQYKNKPLIVGGPLDGDRGVVSTCSYEARKYGIHSAMSIKRARQLCPSGIFVLPQIKKYKEISKQMHKIFHKYTDIIEPLSLDEAYLDVTNNKLNIKSAIKIALLIQREIYDELNLTCSCGISYNKFLAKIASDINKPNGYFLITPDEAISFLETLPIQKFYGIGKKTANKFIQLGIYNGYDLKKLNKTFLEKHFNKKGLDLYDIVRGIDLRPVKKRDMMHSISNERTFINDVIDEKIIKDKFNEIFEIVYNRLLAEKILCKTIQIRIRYSDFSLITRSWSLSHYTNNQKILYESTWELFKFIELEQKVRLLGIGFSNFKYINQNKNYIQLTLNF